MNKFLIKNRIHDYVDGALPQADHLEMEAALVEHPDLIEEVEALQKQREWLLNHGQSSAPEGLLSSILQEVDQLPTTANQPRSKDYLPFAAALVAGLVAWILIPTTTTVETTHHNIKAAQAITPVVNAIKLPQTSPIEEANKHLDSLEKVVTEEVTSPAMAPSKPAQTAKKQKPIQQTPTFVIQTPDSPYVPEWEGGQIIEVSGGSFDADAFQFQSAPANLLFQLENLALQVGGSLKSTNGGSFSSVELTNFTPRAKCEVWVPVAAVDQVNKKLTEMGGRFYGETIRQSGGFAIFKIDARYEYY
jgi:anti-sigma factor RsiW